MSYAPHVLLCFNPLWITLFSNTCTHDEHIFNFWFDHHMNLHYSQTAPYPFSRSESFDHHMNLHYSQTYSIRKSNTHRLTTIWIYTTLKLVVHWKILFYCLTTIWIYTTLKLLFLCDCHLACLTTIWIYTTLKRKRAWCGFWEVWPPYEFTLLSNLNWPFQIRL